MKNKNRRKIIEMKNKTTMNRRKIIEKRARLKWNMMDITFWKNRTDRTENLKMMDMMT